jgi:hypothetical protein
MITMKIKITQNNSFLQKTRFLLSLILCVASYTTNAQSPSVFTYTGTNQTWICPQGVTSIQVEAIGGGGAGVSSTNNNGFVGGGGGGGAYARRNSITVVPGTTYTISATAIGIGGSPTTTGGVSSAGGTTSVTLNGVTLTAANITIWYAPVTSTEMYLQANARIDRQGQKNAMTIVHLQGSAVERKLYKMLQNRLDAHEKLVDLYRQVLTE